MSGERALPSKMVLAGKTHSRTGRRNRY